MNTKNISIYIHLPFCQIKCPYCDFNTYEKLENFIPDYVKSMNTEIHNWSHLLKTHKITSVFFGGGTPSYIKESYIKNILDQLRSRFDINSNAEITLESNPVDLNIRKLTNLLEMGINRLSIGIQSFSDPLLTKLGRNHDKNTALRSIQNTLQAGFKNFNVDLMYGIPTQTVAQWQSSLETINRFKITHLSTYNLTFEKGTPFYSWRKQGKLNNLSDKKTEEMYLMQKEYLPQIGFEHYEISNWSKPNMKSKHNLRYWSGKEYLGIGAGAHSYLNNKRFSNIKSPKSYIENIRNFNYHSSDDLIENMNNIGIIYDQEILNNQDILFDRVMLGLRLIKGINHQEINKKFNINFAERFKKLISELEKLDLIEKNCNITKLTDKGILLSNEIMLKFFQEICHPIKV